MTRKKLAFITKDSARKATFKKRKKALMKKASELRTLCGIDACVIICSPYKSQPEVWPSALGLQRALAQFKRMPEMEQSKKMVNQESFTQQRIAKAKKQHKDNREKEMTEVMYQCLTGRDLQSLEMHDLHDLGWLIDQNLKEIYRKIESLIDQNLKEIYRKIESLKSSSLSSSSSSSSAPPLPPSPHPHPQVVGAPRNTSGGNVDHVVMGEINGYYQKPVVDQLMMNGADVAMQSPQWFAEWMMNNNEPMGFGGDEMMLPFGDNRNAMWSSAFFPYEPMGFVGDEMMLPFGDNHNAMWFSAFFPYEPMGFGGDEMMLPFGDNHNAMWSNAFFPYEPMGFGGDEMMLPFGNNHNDMWSSAFFP